MYFAFLILGFGSFITYYAIMAQINYWNTFYDGEITTILSTAYCIAEIFGGLLIIPMEKKLSKTTLAMIHYIGSIFLLAILVPLKYISNF